MNKTLRIDSINIGLIIGSCAAAHYFPYHLVILSYGILGPAHYLTQISWMHDRKYFVPQSLFAPAVSMVMLVFLIMPENILPAFGTSSITTVLALGIAFFCVLASQLGWQVVIAMASILVTISCFYSPETALFFAIFMPSVIHIFVFTACFMLAGAMRNRQPSSYIAFAVLLISAASFLLPAAFTPKPNLYGIRFFEPIAVYIQMHLPLSNTTITQWFGFLSFAYTYHYFNWFFKAEIIHWHHISRKRIALIVAVYVLLVVIYLMNYYAGFLAVLFFSKLHNLLELPLDLRTISYIGKNLFGSSQTSDKARISDTGTGMVALQNHNAVAKVDA